MLTLKQLSDWLDDIEKILFDVQAISGNIQVLVQPVGNSEKKILQAGFFEHYMDLLRNSLVIQLCKLFINQDKEKRNYMKLFNRLKYDPYDSRLKEFLKGNRGSPGLAGYKHEVISIVDSMIPWLQDRDEIIRCMKVLRDRHFAHTDPGRDLPELSIEALLDLANLSEEIYRTLDRTIFNKEFRFLKEGDWSIEPIIAALVEGHRK